MLNYKINGIRNILLPLGFIAPIFVFSASIQDPRPLNAVDTLRFTAAHRMTNEETSHLRPIKNLGELVVLDEIVLDEAKAYAISGIDFTIQKENHDYMCSENEIALRPLLYSSINHIPYQPILNNEEFTVKVNNNNQIRFTFKKPVLITEKETIFIGFRYSEEIKNCEFKHATYSFLAGETANRNKVLFIQYQPGVFHPLQHFTKPEAGGSTLLYSIYYE